MTALSTRYICAHNRNRDFYQIPLALAEVGALERLVTDHYHNPDIRWRAAMLGAAMGHRRVDGVSPAAVREVWPAAAAQILRPTPFGLVDRLIGRAARRAHGAAPEAGLLIHAGYALEAFEAAARRRPQADRRLFLHHPHPALIERLLTADLERYPAAGARMGASLRAEAGRPARRARLDRELALASGVVVASRLSAQSVAEAGHAGTPCAIAPYGTTPGRMPFDPAAKSRGSAAAPVRMLFVGQAAQRKGLHHLFQVWRDARPPNAELTVIASSDPDGVAERAPPGVEVLTAQPLAALRRHFARAHVFVLPAIVEGFGLVLLEALQAGCYVLASDATGFADLAPDPSVGRVTPAGDLEALASALSRAAREVAEGTVDPAKIAAYGRAQDMARFRAALRQALITGAPGRADAPAAKAHGRHAPAPMQAQP